MRISDWSSDVCSSDLILAEHVLQIVDTHPERSYLSGSRWIGRKSLMQANMMALVAEADAAALAVEAAKSELEIARQAADAAKQVLDSTKGAYDDVLSKADDAGVPKAKLRKLVDERLRALIDAGLDRKST